MRVGLFGSGSMFNSARFILEIRGYEVCIEELCDVSFSFSNSLIFKEVNTRIINFHAAPLPRYRGTGGMVHAIINGDTEYGCTYHEVTDEIDAGPIIYQMTFPIMSWMTAQDLNDICVWLGLANFKQYCTTMVNGKYNTRPQVPQYKTLRRSDLHDIKRFYIANKDELTKMQLETYKRALTFPAAGLSA